MRRPAFLSVAALVALLAMAGLSACSQNEFTEPGPDPPAPKNPRPAQRVEKGEGMAEAPQPPEPEEVRYTGSVVLPAELAPKVKPGMVLFVIAVETGASKPVPLAAKRFPDLSAKAFPIAFELCAHDSMSGDPLPVSGEIVARLDSDGDLKTAVAGDLTAGPIPVRAGTPVELRLQEKTP